MGDGTIGGREPFSNVMMEPVRDPLVVGRLVRDTFSTYFANFASFGTLIALLYAPVIYLQIRANVIDPTEAVRRAKFQIAAGLVSVLVQPIASGALTFGVFQHLRGKPASIGSCLLRGIQRMLPCLAVAILTGLAVLGGAIMCFVPGIMVATALYIALPVAVIERPGIGASLRRSLTLTRGNRLAIFGLMFLLGALQFVLSFAVAIVSRVSTTGTSVTLAVITILHGGLTATAPALAYYRLRSDRESIDAEEIASVFD